MAVYSTRPALFLQRERLAAREALFEPVPEAHLVLADLPAD
jgi:hypothetical protein